VSQTARILGLDTIEVKRLPTSEIWTIDRDNWEEVLAEVDLLMISPQLNPVGCTYTVEDRKWLVDKCKEMDVRIISDEVYSASDSDWKPFFKDGSHCVSISSLTKVHGLGVIRYGWILASEDIIQYVNNAFHNMEGMMASPTIRIAEKVRSRLHEPVELIEEYRKRNIPVLQEALERLGINWTPPKHGVFGAFRIQGVDTLNMIDTIGKDLDLLAVPGCMFDPGLSEWLRIGWSIEPKEFAEAVSVLEEVIRKALNIT
ncbi:MAG: pyridoxal phosphate-dependent aminotransferase, partial [Candidatus Poseidoniaceae archaeon]